MDDIVQNVKVKCITPVHVGSGVKFKQNVEYFFSSDIKSVGIVDDHLILKALGGENANKESINQWVNAIDSNKSILSKPGVNISVEEVSKRIRKTNSFSRNSDLREQLHASLNHPLLPGSSLKGAIRTALWDVLVPDDTITNYDIWNPKRRKYSDKNINIRAFAPKSNGNHMDATKDIMRFLQITDSIFDHNDANIEVSKVLTEQRNGWQLKRFDENIECISKGANSNCRIKISKRNLKNNVEKNFIKELHELTSMQAVFKACNDYTLKMLRSEMNFFNEDLGRRNDHVLNQYLENIKLLLQLIESNNSNTCLIRLGYGTGYTFMTGDKIFSKRIKNDELEEIMRSIRKVKSSKYDDYLYIKSRKVTAEGVPFGFVQLSY